MRGPEFAELTTFVAVAEQRNFTRAAANLGIAPSTLSQTIRALEDRLGVRLLNRTTRSVATTEAGERLLAELQPALDGIDKAMETVNAYRDTPMGTLRLCVSRPASVHIIAPLLSPFLAAHPAITVEITTDDSRQDIVKGGFDAGVRIGELIEQDMIAVLADSYRMVTVASKEYLEKHPAPAHPDDLREHNCIRHRWSWDGILHPWRFERGNERLEVAVEGDLIADDLNARPGRGARRRRRRLPARSIHLPLPRSGAARAPAGRLVADQVGCVSLLFGPPSGAGAAAGVHLVRPPACQWQRQGARRSDAPRRKSRRPRSGGRRLIARDPLLRVRPTDRILRL
jgi:DNA-binding transcriptional LysR family regulator